MMKFQVKKIIVITGVGAVLTFLIFLFGGLNEKIDQYLSIQNLLEMRLNIQTQILNSLQNQVAELEKRLKVEEERPLVKEEIVRREIIREKSQEELLTAAVAKITPAVVSIVVTKDVPKLEIVYENPFGNDPFFKDFNIRIPVWRQKGTELQKVGAGTGFFIRSNGYILTNRHVVEDTQAHYTVLLANGSQQEAQVVYKDNDNDIAIIKINGNYTSANLGDSEQLKIGQSVFTVGNALGEYSNSVSVGIISGLNRNIQAQGSSGTVTLKGVIQTDAAINPGNSGGPLVDLAGKVVGVNVATVIGSENISFSIPINIVKNIIQSVLK